jgi:hypothetical protein
MWYLIDLIQLKLKGYKSIGHIRYKNESMAPKEWKVSLWDKLKKNELFNPININHKENLKEYRIFFKGKVIIIAVNIFLFSFIYSFTKDTYTIAVAKYKISAIEKQDFAKEIPEELLFQYKWNKFKLTQISEPNKIKQIRKENAIIEQWIDFTSNKLKKDYFDNNYNLIKSNILSFANNLLVIYMILKYYWKKKPT